MYIVGGLVGLLAGLGLAHTAVKYADKQRGVVAVSEPQATHIGTPRPEPQLDSSNLVRNGGFEQDWKYWTNYFVLNGAHSIARIDTRVHRDTGRASFYIEHGSDQADNVYATFAQTIYDLEPRRFYRLRFFVKSQHADRKAAFVTIDSPWVPIYLDEGIYDWRENTYDFTPGLRDSIDLRFVVQRRAVIWIDDVSITRLPDVEREQPRH